MKLRNDWGRLDLKCKLGDLCDTVSVTFDKSKENIVLINTSDILDGIVLNHKIEKNEKLKGQFKKTFQKDDILYSEIRPKNKRFAYIDFNAEDYVASTKLMVLRATERVTSKFLYQLLKSEKIISELQTLAESRSGTFPQITYSELSKIEVDVPNIDNQRKITQILENYDEKITLNRMINYHLEQIAQTIFKSWFMDFEPFGRGVFINSELGEIPEGWSVQTIEYLAEKVAMGPFGSNIKVETFVESGVPIISGNHLRGLYLDELGYNFITEEHARRLSNSLVRTGDIIFTHAGNIGQVALIPDDCEYPFYVISQRQFYLRCDKEKAVPEYINYFFHSREGQGKLLANASQTGVPSIARPSSHLKGISVVLPPIEVQQEWLSVVQPMFQALNGNRQENKRLSALRDSLLPRLMSGELSIADLGDAK